VYMFIREGGDLGSNKYNVQRDHAQTAMGTNVRM
jgi:hypothetical protein